MSEWIKKLEDEAKKTLGWMFHFKDGYLLDDRGIGDECYVEYDPNCLDEIDLNGEFDLQQLKDLVTHMEKCAGVNEK